MRPVAALLCALPIAALAQAFPSKPVRISTQFAAGGSGDVSLRTLAPHMSQDLGVPVIIDNRPGGGGLLAADFVAKSAPDGHTLVSGTSATQIILPFLRKDLPFDPVRDFTPVTQLYSATTLIVAHPSVPGASLRELIEYAKKNPGKLSYGSAGIGSPDHLHGVSIAQLAGIEWTHVPYKASSLALNDVVAGQVPVTFTILAAASPMLKSGKVRAIAVVEDKRSPVLLDVPTIGEVVPGFRNVPSWNGIFGPGGVPRPIVERLQRSIVKALNQPDALARWAANGYETLGTTPDEFAAQIKAQYEIAGKLVRAAGLKPE